MARFSLGGDEDGNEEGPGNDRPLPKKPRTSVPIVYTFKRANASAASTSNSGNRAAASNYGNPASTSAARPPPLEPELRQEESATVEEESEEGSEKESDTSLSDSSEEESEEEDEEEEQQNLQSGNEVQPTEARGNSTPNGNGTDRELVGPCGDAPAPVSVTLTDPDVLDCPICLEPLSAPVYQCENGHIACASCCIKMRNKCASCCWPIGYNRCRAIEKVLESVRISCRNMQHGCMESLHYSKKLDHEKTCNYAPCSCPHLGCNYVGLPKRVYMHFATQHSRSSQRFRFNYAFPISLDNNQKHAFLQEKHESIIFILNRSIESLGSFVNVICIAPTSSRREFLYDLTARDGVSSIKLKTVAESSPQWIAQPPAKKYVLVPNDFMALCGQLKLELTIWRDRESRIVASRCFN